MDLLTGFQTHFQTSPSLQVRAPGRVNLLGEHVDYNGGPVLPAAIDRAVRLAAHPSGDDTVTLAALDLDERVSFELTALEKKIDVQGQPLPAWAHYPAGVAWALQQAGLEVKGIQAAYTSDVPIGSGLSSSAAVEVGFAVAWQALGGWRQEPLRLAQLCQRAENQYVGVNSGLMDQFASACGIDGKALYFDTRSLEWYPAPLAAHTAIVIADLGMRRSLAHSGYNERRTSCERAVAVLQQFLPEIQTLRDVPPTIFAAYSNHLDPETRKRAEHVVHEITRVELAVSALRRNDQRTFGALMYASHASLRDLYEVSIPELDALVEIARLQPGVIGARLTGAGFGGCTVNLVGDNHIQEFIQGLSQGYQNRTGRQAQVYLCRASAGAAIEA